MNSNRRTVLIIEWIASLFILLFLYTATTKLFHYDSFVTSMSHSPIIGSSSRFLGWLIPATEIITSALLFFSQSRLIGLIASTLLLTLFTTYIAYMLLFSEKLPCHCGGVIEQLSWKQHLVFNLVFIVLGVIGIILMGKQKISIAIARISRTPV